MKPKMSLVLTLILTMVTSVAMAGTNITFWTTETQSDRQKTIRLLLDTFEALNDGISVKMVAIEENDIPTQIAASSAAGNLPDLVEIGSELAVTYGSSGILDLKAHNDIINKIGKNRFFKGALALVTNPKDGSYFAVPYHGWIQGIWYRADWFDKAGLEPPNNWERILKAARYFHKPEKNQYGILLGTQPVAFTEQVFTQFAISNNARQFNSAGDLVFNSPAMKETLEYYKDLAQYTPPGPQTWRGRDYYIQGKMAMFFYSTYIMDDLALAEVAASSLTAEHFENLKGSTFDPHLVDKTKMAPIISHKTDASYGVVVTLGLVNSQDQARRQAARLLLEYFFDEAAYVTFMHMAPGGMNPMLKDIAQSDDFLNDPRKIFERYGKDKMYKIISGMDAIQKFEIVDGKVFPVSGEIFAKQVIPQMIHKILFENQSIDEGMAWAEKEMRKIIAEFN